MVSSVLILQCKRFSGCRRAVDVNDIVCATRGYKLQPIYIIAQLCQCAESISFQIIGATVLLEYLPVKEDT